MTTDEVTPYPLCWPAGRPRTPESERQRARFSSYGQPLSVWLGMERARRELDRVGATAVVISTNLPLRPGGKPLGREPEPRDPGAAVYFAFEGEPHCLSCDRWDRVADNLAAIALHVEAVRAQLRWGVADLRRLLAGFAAPGAPAPWWRILGLDGPLADAAVIRARYRELAQRHHPDRGGSAARMAAINAAYEQGLAAVRARRG